MSRIMTSMMFQVAVSLNHESLVSNRNPGLSRVFFSSKRSVCTRNTVIKFPETKLGVIELRF